MKKKKKRRGFKVLIAVVSMALIAVGVKVGLAPIDEEYKNASMLKKIENKFENAFESMGKDLKTAKDYTKATTYVLKHQDEVRGVFTQFQNGEITAQEMVDQIATEIDVEYVYDFINEYASDEHKQIIKDYAEELENSGVNIDQYLPEEAKEELFKQ